RLASPAATSGRLRPIAPQGIALARKPDRAHGRFPLHTTQIRSGRPGTAPASGSPRPHPPTRASSFLRTSPPTLDRTATDGTSPASAGLVPVTAARPFTAGVGG